VEGWRQTGSRLFPSYADVHPPIAGDCLGLHVLRCPLYGGGFTAYRGAWAGSVELGRDVVRQAVVGKPVRVAVLVYQRGNDLVHAGA